MASISSFFLPLLLFLVSTGFTESREFLVGGAPYSWKIPSSPDSEPLNRWAEANRFQVGDFLVWAYNAEEDSVLQVSRKDYLRCNTSNPIADHRDGNTRLRLRRQGAYYFVSGEQGACQKGEKLVIVVLSEKHRFTRGVSPAPAPVEFAASALATGGASHESQPLVLALIIVGVLNLAVAWRGLV